MQVQVKKIQSQMAYKADSITFAQDGHVYATYVIGSLKETDEGSIFTPIMSQNFTLTPEDLASMTFPSGEEFDGYDFKSMVQAGIESKLREKDQFNF